MACILFSQSQLVSQSADGESEKGELNKLFVVERIGCTYCWENLVHFAVVEEILVHLLLREFSPFCCCCGGNFGAFVVERIQSILVLLRKFGAIVILRELGPFCCWGNSFLFMEFGTNFCGENLLHLLSRKKLVHWLLRELGAFYGNWHIWLLKIFGPFRHWGNFWWI